jgi:hypothetical protein
MNKLLDLIAKKLSERIDLWNITKLHLGPGDVIVLRTKKICSQQIHDQIVRQISRVFPGVKAIVLDSDMDISIVSTTETI